ncbi:hypothetical protein PFISCL1PPCAC_21710, partial [Pristionchus fissidentatus]
GVRMGLAAHALCYVAECASNLKMSSRPTKTRDSYNYLGDGQVYDVYCKVMANEPEQPTKRRFYGHGDSVAKADFITIFFRNAYCSWNGQSNFRAPFDIRHFEQRVRKSTD